MNNKKNVAGKDLSRMPTGFDELDNMLGGLHPSDYIVIASRPGMGKTSLALNIALRAASTSGKEVVIFSLEMARHRLTQRLLSSLSELDIKEIEAGQIDGAFLSVEAHNRFVDAVCILKRANLTIIDDASHTADEMKEECSRINNLGLVVIDYLQLISAATKCDDNKGKKRIQIVAEISRAIKTMARELNVPVICLSQISRSTEIRPLGKQRPRLSDIRKTAPIVRDTDVIIALYRDGYYDEDTTTPDTAELIVLKNRHGDTGTVKLRWEPEYTRFSPFGCKEGYDDGKD